MLHLNKLKHLQWGGSSWDWQLHAIEPCERSKVRGRNHFQVPRRKCHRLRSWRGGRQACPLCHTKQFSNSTCPQIWSLVLTQLHTADHFGPELADFAVHHHWGVHCYCHTWLVYAEVMIISTHKLCRSTLATATCDISKSESCQVESATYMLMIVRHGAQVWKVWHEVGSSAVNTLSHEYLCRLLEFRIRCKNIRKKHLRLGHRKDSVLIWLLPSSSWPHLISRSVKVHRCPDGGHQALRGEQFASDSLIFLSFDICSNCQLFLENFCGYFLQLPKYFRRLLINPLAAARTICGCNPLSSDRGYLWA